MTLLNISNPFGAPVWHEETVSSTMDAARTLKKSGCPHGTVISADFQESGRGRQSRVWKMDRGQNLIFTIILNFSSFSSLPEALTLKTGLAVSLAIEDFAPALAGSVELKWPNDIMLLYGNLRGAERAAKKAAGILTEAEGNAVYIGVGVNLGQREFPEEYRARAGSVVLALEAMGARAALSPASRFALLEKVLSRLYACVEAADDAWRSGLEERLYRRGERVTFIEGAAGSGKTVEGLLAGIGKAGELLIIPDGEKTARPFFNGELRVYG
jgi:BirA family biotin operon repressor/biotin-[acetyl-CoA-carboxylase] ligase